MSFEIWTAASWAKGGYGGWSHVRIRDGEAKGVAGGDRRTTPYRMSMIAAIEALKAASEDLAAPVLLHTLNRDLLARDDGETEGMAENRDLWDRLAKLTAARAAPVRFAEGGLSPEAKARAAFVDGWAAFALDIARTKGEFQSPIPKPNLTTLMGKK